MTTLILQYNQRKFRSQTSDKLWEMKSHRDSDEKQTDDLGENDAGNQPD